jgi:type II secretory pathway pseudopilin PulG
VVRLQRKVRGVPNTSRRRLAALESRAREAAWFVVDAQQHLYQAALQALVPSTSHSEHSNTRGFLYCTIHSVLSNKHCKADTSLRFCKQSQSSVSAAWLDRVQRYYRQSCQHGLIIASGVACPFDAFSCPCASLRCLMKRHLAFKYWFYLHEVVICG